MDGFVRSCSLPLSLSLFPSLSLSLSVSLCLSLSLSLSLFLSLCLFQCLSPSRSRLGKMLRRLFARTGCAVRRCSELQCGLKMQVDLLTDGVLEHLLGSSADFIRSKGSLLSWNRRLLPGDAVSRLDALPEKRPQQHKTCGGPSLL